MLLTIHNLPASTRYADIKSLLQGKCGLQQVILDNLVGEGVGKKVTVGVAEDADAAILVRKINGLYWNGQQLYVEDVRHQKNASEQPYRTTIPETQETEQPFRTMNLQQHSSYPQGAGMANTAPAIQPMVPMYYVQDYNNQEYMPNVTGMQANFMQSQNYDPAQKVQNYMGVGDVPQTSAQYNQDFSSSDAQNQSSWEGSYNKEEDFIGKRQLHGQRSPAIPANKREPEWVPYHRESPPRGNHGQPWAGRGSKPAQPDFRPNIRPDDRAGLIQPRPDFRPNNLPSLLSLPAQPKFAFNDQGRPNQFSGPRESHISDKRQDRSDERGRFADRSNEFGQSNVRRGPNEFSGRPNERRGNNEFAGEMNQFSGRPNGRRGANEFAGGVNEFSGRPNERRGANEFFGGPNERGLPNEHSRRSNEGRGPIHFSERPNEHRGANNFSGRPNELSGRPNERQRRPNEHQGKPNEFPVRKGQPNDRSGLSRPNREFGRSNERDEFNRSFDRAEFSRRDRPERNTRPDPDSRKRKFDERFDEVERPKRISRPKPSRPNPINNFHMQDDALPADGKLNNRMFINAVKKIVHDMKMNLGIRVIDFETLQAFRKLINDRLESILDGRTMASTLEYYEIYRSMYPKMGDKTTYNTVLAMVSKNAEPVGIVAEAEQPKPEVDKLAPPPKLTKGEKQAIRRQKQAESLLAQGKLPSFPQGDKRKVAQQRKEEKEGHIPEVDTPYKVAIEEELNKVADLFIHELNNAPTAEQQRAYDTVGKTELIDEIKQHLTQNLSRRVSNNGLKVVRIYGYPKLPSRSALETVLFKLGVVSLRKSTKAKMYTAAVDTYECLDKLCAMEALQVTDGITITFKPFHLAVKERADQKLLKRMRRKMIEDMIDKTELNLLDKDWPAREAEIKAAQEAEAQANAALEAEAALKAEAAKEAEAAIKAEAAKEAEAKEVDSEKEAEAAKESESALEVEAMLQDGEKEEPNDTAQNEGDSTETDHKNVTNDYLNDDFHVIDEVNETDSDVEFSGAVVNEAIDLNSVKNGENNGNDNENDSDVENNDNGECIEDDIRDEGDNEFDIDDVDVDINDVDDDDLEDY